MSKSFKRLKSVIGTVGLSRSTIYALMAAGKFPKSISLGERSVGWLESDIQAWIDSRISATNEA
ncbi:AlpA family transcriptional regulator [Methylotenera sp.]|uniref:helix-turn-helix transcriptional regulator n=1 Tax=Methylotenera sp. TaxID=2051956 RepID=UPI0024897AF4|nr:AlpA family transcriptional regulator [Methylotenera sp.]MDI1360863.1 AlpA family transcriptional regulator [Methylotenera sp.]